MGGIGAVAEPLVVIVLLVGGTWINRDFEPGRPRPADKRRISSEDVSRNSEIDGLIEDVELPRSTSPSLLSAQEPQWRTRSVRVFGLKKRVTTPNTSRFKGYFLSRLLQRFPFLVECWYWALIYWVYQLGRAATAVWIVEGTIVAAEKHALQVIVAEQKIRIFWELHIQKFFMQNQFIMMWINRTYSFIHIPGSIAFLIWLFYYTNTRNRVTERQRDEDMGERKGAPAGPRLYESRRRTMAFCNLLAFCIFTAWPCMPPRLLSADSSKTPTGELARSYGFVDTVHGPQGEGSIWTDNRFTNKFAAMPSLHFGYSLLIGLTIATIPLHPSHSPKSLTLPFFNRSHPSMAPGFSFPSWRRILCLFIGFLYPAIILTAIIATANHFILDAVAGSMTMDTEKEISWPTGAGGLETTNHDSSTAPQQQPTPSSGSMLSSSSPTVADENPPADVQTQTAPAEENAPGGKAEAVTPESQRTKLQTTVIMVSLCMSVFLAALDTTIITTALPTISEHFHSNAGYTWIGSAYLLANSASTPSWGKISDIWGRKPILLLAASIFFIGSLLAAVSVSIGMLITARAVQGVGGGGLIILVNICISDLFSMRKRGELGYPDENFDRDVAKVGQPDESKLTVRLPTMRRDPNNPSRWIPGDGAFFRWSNRQCDWDNPNSVKALNSWRSQIFLRSLPPVRKTRQLWLRIEQQFVLDMIREQLIHNRSPKWIRLTNAYNRHFHDTHQRIGEEFVSPLGHKGGSHLKNDRLGPWRTSTAIKGQFKKWPEGRKLIADALDRDDEGLSDSPDDTHEIGDPDPLPSREVKKRAPQGKKAREARERRLEEALKAKAAEMAAGAKRQNVGDGEREPESNKRQKAIEQAGEDEHKDEDEEEDEDEDSVEDPFQEYFDELEEDEGSDAAEVVENEAEAAEVADDAASSDDNLTPPPYDSD
ncbi:hypothetical protein B7494_g2795 [Chlorociboria aeruginascens]|nr:hypothetical protein B7494_g2795 [Chlorociboria aeruginascens]